MWQGFSRLSNLELEISCQLLLFNLWIQLVPRVIQRSSGSGSTQEVLTNLILNHRVFPLVKVVFDLDLFYFIDQSMSSHILLIFSKLLLLWMSIRLNELRFTLQFSQFIRDLINEHVVRACLIMHARDMNQGLSFSLMLIELVLVKAVDVRIVGQFRIQEGIPLHIYCFFPFPKLALFRWRDFGFI